MAASSVATRLLTSTLSSTYDRMLATQVELLDAEGCSSINDANVLSVSFPSKPSS